MEKKDILPWDWKRILLGQAPSEFLIETFVRTVIIYVLLLVVLKVLGKRMDGQLTLTEMAVMVTFGAIVSVPMQMPERGILLGVIALACATIFQRGLNWLTVKSKRFEDVSQGTASMMVKNGLMLLDEMRKAGISKQHLFSVLRGENIFSLGKVKRVYFEACGLFTIFDEEKEKKPGLPVLPSNELEFVETQTTVEKSKIACCNCGHVADERNEKERCRNCGESTWIKAIY